MRIERIELENWMSYPRRWTLPDQPGATEVVPTIDLSGPPLVLITGDNGAGKSAILEAICYALFAQYPRGKKNKDAIRSGEAKAKIRLRFRLSSAKDVTYCVERVLSVKPAETNAVLTKIQPDGSSVLVQKGQSAVTEYIVQHLLHGIGYDAFVSAVFLRQDEAGKFMDMSHADQKKQLLSLCRLEIYGKIHEKAKQLRKQTSSEVEGFQQHFQKVEYATDRYLADRRRDVEQLAATRDRLRAEEEAARQLCDQAKRAAAVAQEIHETRQQLDRWSQILERAAEIRHASLWTAAWDRIRNPLAQGARLHGEQMSRQAEIERVRRNLETATKDASDTKSRHNNLSAEHQSTQQELRRASASLLALTRRRDRAEQALLAARRAERLDAEIAKLRREQQDRARQLERLEPTKRQRDHYQLLTLAHHVLRPVLQELAEAQEEKVAALEQDAVVQAARLKEEEARKLIQAAEARRQNLDTSATALSETQRRLHREQAASQDIVDNRTRARDAGVCPTCGTAIVGDISVHVCAEIDQHVAKLGAVKRELETIKGEIGAVQSETVLLNAKKGHLERERIDSEASARHAETTASRHRAAAAKREKAATKQWRQMLAHWRDISAPDWLVEPSPDAQHALEAELNALAGVEDEHSRLADLEATYKAQSDLLASHEKSRAELDITSPITEQHLAELASAHSDLNSQTEEAETEHVRLEAHRAQVERELRTAQSASETAEKVRAKLDTELTRLTSAQAESERSLRTISATLKEEQHRTEHDLPDLAGSLLPALQNTTTLGGLQELAKGYLEIARLEPELNRAESESARVSTALEIKEAELLGLQEETHGISEEDAEHQWKNARRELTASEQNLLTATEEIGRIQGDHETRGELAFSLRQARRQQWAYQTIEDAIRPGTATQPSGPLYAQITHSLMHGICREASAILDDLVWPIRIAYDKDTGFSIEDRALSAVRAYKEYSGGERFAIAISVALAIGRVTHGAANIRCLFVDEGFGALDQNHRQRIIDDAISRLIQVGTRDQVVVISHLRDLHDYFPTRLELRREGDRSALGSAEDKY